MEADLARDHAPPSFTLNVQAAPDSVQAAFLRRAISALERIAGSASAKTLTDALAASTDVGSLARLLSRSDVVGSAVIDLDPLPCSSPECGAPPEAPAVGGWGAVC